MSESDDLPIFRPRMEGGQKFASRKERASFRGALLARIARGGRGAGRTGARSRVVALRPARRRPGRIDDSILTARLEHLEGLRLAERVSPSVWSLREGWQGQLREMGSRGDILKQMHAALSGDPARYRIVREGQALAPDAGAARVVLGRVVRKGLSDELKGRFYAVIETPTGHGYHVPLDLRSANRRLARISLASHWLLRQSQVAALVVR